MTSLLIQNAQVVTLDDENRVINGGSVFVEDFATLTVRESALENGLQDEIFNFDCAGYYGETCGQPHPEWSHRLRATWETNFRLNISLAWRYVGEVINDDYSSDSDLTNPGNWELWEANGIDKIDAYNYFDLAASYTLRNGIKFTLGINNGIRAGDLLNLKVGELRYLNPGQVHQITESKTKKKNIISSHLRIQLSSYIRKESALSIKGNSDFM